MKNKQKNLKISLIICGIFFSNLAQASTSRLLIAIGSSCGLASAAGFVKGKWETKSRCDDLKKRFEEATGEKLNFVCDASTSKEGFIAKREELAGIISLKNSKFPSAQTLESCQIKSGKSPSECERLANLFKEAQKRKFEKLYASDERNQESLKEIPLTLYDKLFLECLSFLIS